VWQGFANGAVLLAQPLAYRLNLDVGATLRLRTVLGAQLPSLVYFANMATIASSVRISRAVVPAPVAG